MNKPIKPPKPLGQKAYGSIPHLPGSRLGPADHSISEGQARICTERTRDRHDLVVVQEKLDGSNVAVAKVGGEIVALGRAGYPAETSPHVQHKVFALWVERERKRFDALLDEGERVVGEWLAQAHGTFYHLPHEPFVPFDIMTGTERRSAVSVWARARSHDFVTPRLVAAVGGPVSVEAALVALGYYGAHGAQEMIEGAVWRVERRGKVDFLAKYVRPGKIDGRYLPEISGNVAVWNIHPDHDWIVERVDEIGAREAAR